MKPLKLKKKKTKEPIVEIIRSQLKIKITVLFFRTRNKKEKRTYGTKQTIKMVDLNSIIN